MAGLDPSPNIPSSDGNKKKGPPFFTRIQSIRKAIFEEMRQHGVQYQAVLRLGNITEVVEEEKRIVQKLHHASELLWEISGGDNPRSAEIQGGAG